MTVVKVYGSGCEKCRKLYENAQMALDAAGVEANIEKVSDMEAIVAAGVLMTPALEIDGRIVCSGQVMAAKDILALLPVPDAESGCACACGCGSKAASGGSCGCGGESKAPSGGSCCCGGEPKAPSGGSCGCGSEPKAASGGSCGCGGNAGSPGRRLLRYVLLTFVGVAVAVMLVRESGGGLPEEAAATVPAVKAVPTAGSVSAEPSLTVYYFHGNMRCVTCGKFERLTREVLEGRFGERLASGEIRLRVVNLEAPGNGHYAEEYGLTTRSVVLVGASGFRRLDGIWEKIRESDAAFSEYVASNVSEMLEGR